MKNLDIVAAVLLVVGGLNLGLIGFFGFDFIGMLFGQVEFLPRLIYCFVGIAALYYIWRNMRFRWK